MEISQVRRQLQAAIAAARERSQQHRQRTADAERAYAAFLDQVATPVVRQLANALKTEGLAFTLFTPGDGLKLAAERGRDDFIELRLDTSGAAPQVIGRVSHTRGSRTFDEERPLKPGSPIDGLTDEDVLAFFLEALQPWLNR